jgi:hypothetical protein
MRFHAIVRLSFYVGLAVPMYFCGIMGPMSAAIVGYVLCVTIYLFVQAVTGFRHSLHGVLSVSLLAVLYALLIPALSKARSRSVVVSPPNSIVQPNQTVEATAPRRFSFDHSMFYCAIVPVRAALPGAVPHLGRYAELTSVLRV